MCFQLVCFCTELATKGKRRQEGKRGSTSFSLPEVKEGVRMARILLHWSSSATDTASCNGPFKWKFYNENRRHLSMQKIHVKISKHNNWLSVTESYGECAYSTVGEIRVAFLYKNCFYCGRFCDTNRWLTTIIDAIYKKKGKEYDQISIIMQKYVQNMNTVHNLQTYPHVFPYFWKHSVSNWVKP